MYVKNYYYNHCSDLLFLSSAKLKLKNMFKKCICQKCTCPKNYLIPVFNKVCDIVSFPIKNVNKLISTACVSTFNFLSKSKFIYCKTFFFFEENKQMKEPPLQNDNFSKSVIWGTGCKFFYFEEKLWKLFHSQDIELFFIFNHVMIHQMCDVMISISTWDTVHFWIHLLNHNSLTL